jgi:hypothetical protein
MFIGEQKYTLYNDEGDILAEVYGLANYQPGKSGRIDQWRIVHIATGGSNRQDDELSNFKEVTIALASYYFSGKEDRVISNLKTSTSLS